MTYKPIFVVVPIIAVLLGAILLPLSLHPVSAIIIPQSTEECIKTQVTASMLKAGETSLANSANSQIAGEAVANLLQPTLDGIDKCLHDASIPKLSAATTPAALHQKFLECYKTSVNTDIQNTFAKMAASSSKANVLPNLEKESVQNMTGDSPFQHYPGNTHEQDILLNQNAAVIPGEISQCLRTTQ